MRAFSKREAREFYRRLAETRPIPQTELEFINPFTLLVAGVLYIDQQLSREWRATGQALYALAHAGIKPNDPVITRAHAFLIKTQRADGSWPMTSRPIHPKGAGSKSLIPITGAGSAWAVLGLVRSR